MNSFTAYLRSISIDPEYPGDKYPFNLPAVRQLDDLPFHPEVTFFVGENGSGKSTLIEALAMASGMNAEGGSKNLHFSTRATHSDLHHALKVVRGASRPKDGYFLRAESFYNVASAVDDVDHGALTSYYGGKSLHAQSHGEAFLALVRHRFYGSGLYIMDEPEAALSVARQMELLAEMYRLVQDNSQLIIATHSPILLSYPGSVIYHISDEGIRKVDYEDTEQYQMTKYFLGNYQAILQNILQK